MIGRSNRPGDSNLLRHVPALVTLALAVLQLVLLAGVGNGLLPAQVGDPYGEADALRSAGYYAQHGLTSNDGLPNILTVERFPDVGWLGDLRTAERTGVPSRDATPLRDGVYTRYPPLPNLLLGAMELAIGYQPLVFRVLPLCIGLVAFYLFATALLTALGPVRGAIAVGGVAALPMTSSHMSGLHYEGYAFALLLLELTVLIRYHADARPMRSAPWLLALLGFIQGWLSFDYAFVITLAPVVVSLLFRDVRQPAVWLQVSRDSVIVGAAFTAAHVVHFVQVASFHGSARLALLDWQGRAAFRAAGVGSESFLSLQWRAVQAYAGEFLSPTSRHFGPAVLPWLVLFGAGVCVHFWRTRDLPTKTVWPVVMSLAAAFSWVLVMPQMSLVHRHIMPRLFFLPALTFMIVTLRLFTFSRVYSPTERTAPAQ